MKKRGLIIIAVAMTLMMMFSSMASANVISNTLTATFTVSDPSIATVDNVTDLNAKLGDNAITTINITGGIYTGQFTINRNIVINGSKEANNPTIFQPIDTLATTFTRTSDSKDFRPIITIKNASNVELRNIVVDGLNKGNTNVGFTGIGVYNASATIDSVEVKNIKSNPLAGSQYGYGIVAYNNDSNNAQTVNVSHSTITNYQKNGMMFDGASLTANGTGLTVNTTYNTVTGAGSTITNCQNGIVYMYNAKGNIAHNTISNHKYYNNDQWLGGACGVLIYNSTGDATGITVNSDAYSNNDNNFLRSSTANSIDPVTLDGKIGEVDIDPTNGLQVDVNDVTATKDITINAHVNGLQEFYNAKLVIDFGSDASKAIVKLGDTSVTPNADGLFELGNVQNITTTQSYNATISFTQTGTYNARIYIVE